MIRNETRMARQMRTWGLVIGGLVAVAILLELLG